MALAYLTINLDAFTGDDHPPVPSYSTITLDPGADHIDAAADVIHVRTIVVSLDRQGKAASANGVACVDGKVPVVAGVAYAVSAPNVLRDGPHYVPALTAGQVVDLSDYITPGAPLTPDQAATLTARIVALETTPPDHGALTGLGEDDHPQYALADGTRGSFATTAQGALADTAVQPAALAGYPETYELVDPKARKFAKSAPPTLTTYPGQYRPHHRVMFQDGDILYAIAQAASWAVLKSTDFGATWTQRGTLPAGSTSLIKVKATGTLLSVDISPYTSAGTPAIRRSTNDGTTWTAVHTLAFPTLAHQGIVEAADGSLIVGEYGNVANTVYRAFRSTDDGATWTQVFASGGTDPTADPGHIHSIAVDPYNDKLVLFLDRPTPELWASSDHGATWSLLGTSTDVKHPNWVQPMFFPEHIVWGTDNQSNGRICRITREDFYAGDFDAAEVISLVNRKANYYTFPLRTDVWLMTQSTEVIAPGAEPTGPGSYFSEVYLVSDEGATVSSAYESAHLEATVGALEGLRARLPAFHYSTVLSDGGKGRTWISVNNHRGTVESFSALPVTQGYAPPKAVAPVGPLVPGATRQMYPGWWYGPDGRGNALAGIADGRLTIVPLWVPTAMKFDKIACEVGTGVPGSTVKMCVFASDQFDRPSILLRIFAAQDASTSGVKEVFIGPILQLSPGLYWLGAVPIGSALSLRTVGTMHLPGMPTTAFAPGGTGATSEANCFYQDAMSTPTNWPTSYAVTTNGIKVMLRASV